MTRLRSMVLSVIRYSSLAQRCNDLGAGSTNSEPSLMPRRIKADTIVYTQYTRDGIVSTVKTICDLFIPVLPSSPGGNVFSPIWYKSASVLTLPHIRPQTPSLPILPRHAPEQAAGRS